MPVVRGITVKTKNTKKNIFFGQLPLSRSNILHFKRHIPYVTNWIEYIFIVAQMKRFLHSKKKYSIMKEIICINYVLYVIFGRVRKRCLLHSFFGFFLFFHLMWIIQQFHVEKNFNSILMNMLKGSFHKFKKKTRLLTLLIYVLC